MLNTIQHKILEETFKYIVLDIKENCPFQEAINAFKSIFYDGLYLTYKKRFEELGVLGSIDQVREIYRHLNPQNRPEGSPYVGQEPGYVVWEPNGHDKGTAKELKGLLGLSASNDETTAPVTRDDVVLFVEALIENELKFVKNMQAFYSYMRTQALKRFKANQFDQLLQLYIEPEGRHFLGNEELFNLIRAVRDFFSKKAPEQALAILGNSGAGNSLLTQKLEYDLLWENDAPDSPIPIRIELKYLQKDENISRYVERTVKTIYGCGEKQLQKLRKQQAFIFILDGYDELEDTYKRKNLFLAHQLQQWNCKLIVTCRNQYVDSAKHNRFFAPHPDSHDSGLLVFELMPFSDQQIAKYLERYSKQRKKQISIDPLQKQSEEFESLDKLVNELEEAEEKANLHTFQEWLEKVPDIKELLRNPFLLTSITRMHPKLFRLIVTSADNHWQFYEIITQQWFQRETERFRSKIKESEPTKFRQFSQELAYHMLCRGVTEVKYVPDTGESSMWEKFFSSTAETLLIRLGCPLRRSQENHSSFLNKYLLKYFAACHFIDALKAEDLQTILTIWCGCALPEEHEVLKLLANRVEVNPKVNEKLFALIEESKTNVLAALAASNAITVLNWAGVSFSGMDFTGIRIPGADLQGAVMHYTKLSKADLKKANLISVGLRRAKLSNTDMTEVEFGERQQLIFDDNVKSVCYSSDGNLLAVASGREIHLVDSKTNKKLKTLTGHTKNVIRCTFSVDGRILVSSSRDKSLKLWDVESGKCEQSLVGHESRIICFALSPDKKVLASGGQDKTIRLWDLSTGWCTKSIIQTKWIIGLAFLPSGKALASVSSMAVDGLSDSATLQLWDVITGEYLKTSVHFQADRNLCTSFSPDGKILAATCADKTLRLWDVVTGEVYKFLKDIEVDFFTFSSDGKLLMLYSDYSNCLRLWDIKTSQFQKIQTVKDSIFCLPFFKDEKILIIDILEDKKNLRFWEMAKTYCQKTFANSYSFESLAYSPNDEMLALANDNGIISLWNLKVGYCQKILTGQTRGISLLTFSPCGKTLVSSNGSKIYFWDVVSGQCQKILTQSCDRLVFSPDGGTLAIEGRSDLILLNLTTNKSLLLLKKDDKYVSDISDFAFSSNEKILIIFIYRWSGHNINMNSLALWDVLTGKCQRYLQTTAARSFSMQTPGEEIFNLMMSPNGSTLALLGWQQINFGEDNFVDNYYIKLWNISKKDEMDQKVLFSGCSSPSDYTSLLAFSSDGQLFVSPNNKHNLCLWNVATGNCLKILVENLPTPSNSSGRHFSVFNLTGEILVTNISYYSLDFWNIKTGEKYNVPKQYFSWPKQIFFNKENHIFVIDDSNHLTCIQPIYSDQKEIIDWMLAWTTRRTSDSLWVEGCEIDGARGLSKTNIELLKQRGTVGEPTPLVEIESKIVASSSSKSDIPMHYDANNPYHQFQPRSLTSRRNTNLQNTDADNNNSSAKDNDPKSSNADKKDKCFVM